MNKILLTLLALASIGFAATNVSVSGSNDWSRWVYWVSGSDTSQTVRVKNSIIEIDTSGSGDWVRIDNTADSCSAPVTVSQGRTDADGPTYIWKQMFGASVLNSDASTGMLFYIESRRARPTMRRGVYQLGWSDWVEFGQQVFDGNIDPKDSLTVGEISVVDTYKMQERGFQKDGEQVRFCPAIVGTVGASDSVVVDSAYVVFE